jgi:hypothetical protein
MNNANDATILQNYHFNNQEGNPAGGTTMGPGFTVAWQNGPIKEAGGQNGAMVEDVIAAAVKRLEFYQQSKFACAFNSDAIKLLNRAIHRLGDRTRDRESRGVEGTHQK